MNELYTVDSGISNAEIIHCKKCDKGISASVYARHLEKCMGLQGARGSQRRGGGSSSGELHRSSPEKGIRKSNFSKKSRDSSLGYKLNGEKSTPKGRKKSNLSIEVAKSPEVPLNTLPSFEIPTNIYSYSSGETLLNSMSGPESNPTIGLPSTNIATYFNI
ncbi:hypothetical protein HMI56_003545 [Coelomomyces lativittatus]|nr:hypothetical protein HMI56_003545 [Coelomomyces lativittatus]